MFNLRGFDLNLLTVFEAIYEAGSVSRAADRLALSQAATSHALGRLREVCGDELFVRAGPQFAPTPVAQALYPNVQNALGVLRAGLTEARGFDPAISERQFNVAIPHPLGPFIAQRLRIALANAAPQVVLRTDTKTMPADFTQDMREGRLDLAIDWLRVEHDRFVNKVILSEELMLVARREHPRIGTAPTLEEVLREDFVWLHARRPREQRPEAVRKIEDLGFRLILQVSEALEIPTLVSVFDLLSIVPRSLAPTLVNCLGLKVVPIPASFRVCRSLPSGTRPGVTTRRTSGCARSSPRSCATRPTFSAAAVSVSRAAVFRAATPATGRPTPCTTSIRFVHRTA